MRVILLRISSVEKVAVSGYIAAKGENLHFLPLTTFIDAKSDGTGGNGFDCWLLISNHVTGSEEDKNRRLRGLFCELFAMFRDSS